MRKSKYDISSISDILKNLKRDIKKFEGEVWFRGQSDFSWGLVPSYFRKQVTISEFTKITRFRQNASLLIAKTPVSYFDWLFQMQHHGFQTRLLDWTESALVALYFAVEDHSKIQIDGAFWVLFPTELNKNANIYSPKERNYIPSFEDSILKNYDPETFHLEENTKLLPVAAIATRNNARMQAQLGVFTISHRDTTPIENIGNKKHVKKYKIPARNKAKIKEELSLLGITKFQVFPELSSISEIMKEKL